MLSSVTLGSLVRALPLNLGPEFRLEAYERHLTLKLQKCGIVLYIYIYVYSFVCLCIFLGSWYPQFVSKAWGVLGFSLGGRPALLRNGNPCARSAGLIWKPLGLRKYL